MASKATGFGEAIAEAYAAEGAAIDLGRGVHDGKLDADAVVQVPLRMMNRHGLIAGATGTGKTVTLHSREGKALQRKIERGLFGMLRKRL